jgi:hypothetical protein
MDDASRRALLARLAKGTGAAAAAAASWPLAAALVEPLFDEPRSADAPWVDVGLRGLLRDPGAPSYYDAQNRMPDFGARLAPEQIDDLVAFLQSLEEEDTAP